MKKKEQKEQKRNKSVTLFFTSQKLKKKEHKE
jgi:hypothetical protein